jgi:hypothetical protein
MQFMISCLIIKNHMDSCIITLQTSAMFFASYMLVWDPKKFTIYRVLMFTRREFVDNMLGYCSRLYLDDCSK